MSTPRIVGEIEKAQLVDALRSSSIGGHAVTKAAVDLARALCSSHDVALAELASARAARDAAVAEAERLRTALVRCGRAVGGKMADDVSVEFLGYVPEEAERFVARLQSELAQLRKVLLILDRIVVGGEPSNGTEPEGIQPSVEVVVNLRTELAATKAKLAHRDTLLSKLEAWCRTGGKNYVPTPGSSDSFGDGVRQAQREVQAMLAVNLATTIAAAEQGGAS